MRSDLSRESCHASSCERQMLKMAAVTPTLTGRAGPVRHAGDESLLFAGRLAAVTLVLVGVSVGAAHGNVVFVALGRKYNPTVTRSPQNTTILYNSLID